MITAGLLTLAVLGPVFLAVVSMRSTPESRGATAGAWIVAAILLALVAAAAAVIGGAIVVLARRAYRHLRGRAA